MHGLQVQMEVIVFVIMRKSNLMMKMMICLVTWTITSIVVNPNAWAYKFVNENEVGPNSLRITLHN